jgi:hypothetical protein
VTLPLDRDLGTHYDREPLVIENQTFYCMGPGQTAITLKWPESPSIAQCGAIIRNCCFKPGTHEWANLIDLENGWHVTIDSINGYGGPTGVFQNGIILRGQTMNTMISRLTVTHPITGVLITGESEGTKISHSEILASIYGVVANTPQGEAALWINDTHLAVARAGIVAINRPQSYYHDLLIYRHDWRAGKEFDGIYLGSGCDDTQIHDVSVKTFGNPGRSVYIAPSNKNVLISYSDVRLI